MRRFLLPLMVFLTGSCVLVVEVTATRILAPYFGNTIFTFSSVISVILAALSAGYYVGGALSDRHPTPKLFFGIVSLSGVAVLLLELLSLWLMPMLGYKLGVMWGPLVLSLLLFFIPAFLLGTLSPFAIRLQVQWTPDAGVGLVSGKIFFWSTLGSITGSLLAGFVLIPQCGINAIITGTGIVLGVTGIIGFLAIRGRLAPAVLLIAGLACFGGGVEAMMNRPLNPGVVFMKDGVYERLLVMDGEYHDRPTRMMRQDRAVSGYMFLDNDETARFTQYVAAADSVTSTPREGLVIGGGGYLAPKLMLNIWSGIHVDVAEIEPSLIDVAHEYFRLPETSRLTNHVADGRRYLHDCGKKFDIIFSDVFYAMSIPPHIATTQFFQLAKDHLNPDGVFMANFVGDLVQGEPNILFSEMRTLKKIFPNCYFFAVDGPDNLKTQSVIAMGINGPDRLNFQSPHIVKNVNPIVRGLEKQQIDPSKYDLKPYTILTDNYCPAEYIAMNTLRREMAR